MEQHPRWFLQTTTKRPPHNLPEEQRKQVDRNQYRNHNNAGQGNSWLIEIRTQKVWEEEVAWNFRLLEYTCLDRQVRYDCKCI